MLKIFTGEHLENSPFLWYNIYKLNERKNLWTCQEKLGFILTKQC